MRDERSVRLLNLSSSDRPGRQTAAINPE